MYRYIYIGFPCSLNGLVANEKQKGLEMIMGALQRLEASWTKGGRGAFSEWPLKHKKTT